MKKSLLKISLVFIFLNCTYQVKLINAKALIFDVGYTLIKPRKWYIANYLGLPECIRLFLEHGRGMQSLMTERMFNILESDGWGINTSGAKDPGGRLLPKLMADWLMGKCTSQYALTEALRLLELQGEYWNKTEKAFLSKAFNLLFNPKQYTISLKSVPLMQAVLHKCARNPYNTFYILSNWDIESFNTLYRSKDHYNTFRYFKPENIFISGYQQELKPSPYVYQDFLQKTKLKPEDCIFIDDQKENIQAAQKAGIPTIHFQDKNIRALLRELKEHGAFSPEVR